MALRIKLQSHEHKESVLNAANLSKKIVPQRGVGQFLPDKARTFGGQGLTASPVEDVR